LHEVHVEYAVPVDRFARGRFGVPGLTLGLGRIFRFWRLARRETGAGVAVERLLGLDGNHEGNERHKFAEYCRDFEGND